MGKRDDWDVLFRKVCVEMELMEQERMAEINVKLSKGHIDHRTRVEEGLIGEPETYCGASS